MAPPRASENTRNFNSDATNIILLSHETPQWGYCRCSHDIVFGMGGKDRALDDDRRPARAAYPRAVLRAGPIQAAAPAAKTHAAGHVTHEPTSIISKAAESSSHLGLKINLLDHLSACVRCEIDQRWQTCRFPAESEISNVHGPAVDPVAVVVDPSLLAGVAAPVARNAEDIFDKDLVVLIQKSMKILKLFVNTKKHQVLRFVLRSR